MKTVLISQARRELGKLLREAQEDKEVPFTVTLRHSPACVGAPREWFKRACRGLNPAPTIRSVTLAFPEQPVHDAQRGQLAHMVQAVVEEGAFFELKRVWGMACVLVPIPWYNERVKAIGPPAGETPEEEQEAGT
ncbi:type II toxin-antitoxin system Phd/YefM family antitoxin [Streptomyces violaceusniger]|uniref:Uncharacterized protein n=1 Tax=Streptomyces violaceusniger (strain Tu 4113) TaxID=653045 RepID=G2PHN0_STRV4|nr:type II toxin-antitoxin system Phd/YefM family antitoxin [Streptomyces violaceusniger]AEM88831.1 hypothetical protein Strvi_0055 [Streptomyces violaceusniger Tu 4113]